MQQSMRFRGNCMKNKFQTSNTSGSSMLTKCAAILPPILSLGPQGPSPKKFLSCFLAGRDPLGRRVLSRAACTPHLEPGLKLCLDGLWFMTPDIFPLTVLFTLFERFSIVNFLKL